MVSSLIFFPEKKYTESPSHYNLRFQEFRIPVSETDHITAWFLPADQNEGVLFFSHGNAGNMSHRLSKIKGWVERGFSVVLWDYRGYGESSGSIANDEQVFMDAQKVITQILGETNESESKLILMGESLGSYPSVRLAGVLKARALILEAPFPSFKELAALHYPWIPAFMSKSLLKNYSFSNEDYFEKIQSPLLIMHGTADEICPHELSKKLFEKAPEPKIFFSIPGGMHNDLAFVLGEKYWDKPISFLQKFAPLSAAN